MRMSGSSKLTRQRLPPVTHTDALFADQSHSILDNLVELLESGTNIGPMAKMLGQVADCLYRRANRMAASGAQSRRSWLAVIRQELPQSGPPHQRVGSSPVRERRTLVSLLDCNRAVLHSSLPFS